MCVVRLGLVVSLLSTCLVVQRTYGAPELDEAKVDTRTQQFIARINSKDREEPITKEIVDFYKDYFKSHDPTTEKKNSLSLVTLAAYGKYKDEFIDKILKQLFPEVPAKNLAEIAEIISSQEQEDAGFTYKACLFWLEIGEHDIALKAFPGLFDTSQKLPPLTHKAEVSFYSCPFQHALAYRDDKAQILLSKVQKAIDWESADAKAKIEFYYRSGVYHREMGPQEKAISEFEKAIALLDTTAANSSDYAYLTVGLISSQLADLRVDDASKGLLKLKGNMERWDASDSLSWNYHLLSATAAFLQKNKAVARRQITFLYNVGNKLLKDSKFSNNYLPDLVYASLISHYFGFTQYGKHFLGIADSVKRGPTNVSRLSKMAGLLEIYSKKSTGWRTQYKSRLEALQKEIGENSPAAIYFKAAI